MHGELTRMQKETLNLQLSLQRYIGEDLSSIQFGDLHELEKQLEYSVNKVRARKVIHYFTYNYSFFPSLIYVQL